MGKDDEFPGAIEEDDNDMINFDDSDFLMDEDDIEDELLSETVMFENSTHWGNSCQENSAAFQYTQTRNVKIPKAGNMYAIETSRICRIKELCQRAKQTKPSYSELFLGISTLFLGAFFSALISKVPYEAEVLSIFFYSICPLIGGGMGIAYFFKRKSSATNVVRFADEICEYLGNVDEVDE